MSKATVKFMLIAGCVPVVKVVLSYGTALLVYTLINIDLTWSWKLEAALNTNLT